MTACAVEDAMHALSCARCEPSPSFVQLSWPMLQPDHFVTAVAVAVPITGAVNHLHSSRAENHVLEAQMLPSLPSTSR